MTQFHDGYEAPFSITQSETHVADFEVHDKNRKLIMRGRALTPDLPTMGHFIRRMIVSLNTEEGFVENTLGEWVKE